MVAFPLVKLAALALRQISKPLANRLKTKAKNSLFFRTYICMPPAQLYHWVEVNVKMRMLNLGKPTEVPKLNETMAIELGADLLGEATIFMIAVFTLTAEYVRNSRNDKAKEAAKEERFRTLQNDIDDLKFVIEKNNAELLHLTRMYNAMEEKVQLIGSKKK
ncbi:putative OPA3-like protein CG13603 [Trichonephila clavata]|uniref:Putative OPA3-like protein CG13603 n=1 Tax=Trichonephila clavata TaxID=2740835 RepID=A0A8X6LDY3_TRICU|nr:putative OPA3-like protein CG13603 [Trichonephila clavata]